jgi:hypothetical protein
MCQSLEHTTGHAGDETLWRLDLNRLGSSLLGEYIHYEIH